MKQKDRSPSQILQQGDDSIHVSDPADNLTTLRGNAHLQRRQPALHERYGLVNINFPNQEGAACRALLIREVTDL